MELDFPMVDGPFFDSSARNLDCARAMLALQGEVSHAAVQAALTARIRAFMMLFPHGGEEFDRNISELLSARDTLLAAALPVDGTPVPHVDAINGTPDATSAEPEAYDAPTYVTLRDYLQDRRILCLYDGSFGFADAQSRPTGPEDIGRVLQLPELSYQSIVEDFLLQCEARDIPITAKLVKPAFNHLIRLQRATRKHDVLGPLMAPPTPEETERAPREWARVATLFEGDGDLAIAILKQFIWQVKLKSANLDDRIQFHMMPIVIGKQGGGKSTFLRNFIGVLQELATEYRLPELLDPRVGAVFRFPIVCIDDVGAIPVNKVPDLKNIITAGAFSNRVLGSSATTKLLQKATLIGSSNTPIRDLVPDQTGHRRFPELHFRSGDVVTGGDPEVWSTVNGLDYPLLWRSVDLWGPSPVAPFRARIAEVQAPSADARLEAWLKALELDSEAVRAITKRQTIPALDLHRLYLKQTGETLSIQAFSSKMEFLCRDPMIPFDLKKHMRDGNVYPIRGGGRRDEQPLP